MKQKLTRPFIRNRISTPYISQAYFRSTSDVVLTDYNSVLSLTQKKLSEARVIYCKSSILRVFLDEYSRKLAGKIVVSGGSDEIFIDEDLSLGNLERVYLQNSHISDGKRVLTLPIGLEDLSLALNGFPSYLKSRKGDIPRRILIGPFSKTHPIRSELLESIAPTDELITIQDQISPRTYSRMVRDFPAVACPRGNGEDTHRLWETLYRGSLPIVVRNNWSTSLKQIGLPLIQIEDWTVKSLLCAIPAIPDQPLNTNQISALWADYWVNEFKTFI